MRELPNQQLRNMIKARVSTAALGNWKVMLIATDYTVHEFSFPFADTDDIRFLRAVRARQELLKDKELLAVVHLGFPGDADKYKAMVEYVPDHGFYSLDYRVQPTWANDETDAFKDAVAMYREVWFKEGGATET